MAQLWRPVTTLYLVTHLVKMTKASCNFPIAILCYKTFSCWLAMASLFMYKHAQHAPTWHLGDTWPCGAITELSPCKAKFNWMIVALHCSHFTVGSHCLTLFLLIY